MTKKNIICTLHLTPASRGFQCEPQKVFYDSLTVHHIFALTIDMKSCMKSKV